MLDLCQAFVVLSEAQRFPQPGVHSEMRNETMASRCVNGRSGFPMLFLVGMALLGKAAPAQTIRVDTTAGRAIRFDPDQALGSSMDILPANLVDKVYSEPILKESLSAGWGPITYRQNTELTIAAWHWNRTWSDPSHQSGYFTGSAEPQVFFAVLLCVAGADQQRSVECTCGEDRVCRCARQAGGALQRATDDGNVWSRTVPLAS